MADDKVTMDDVYAAVLAKLRSQQCDGSQALDIANWFVARLEGAPKPSEGEPAGRMGDE